MVTKCETIFFQVRRKDLSGETLNTLSKYFIYFFFTPKTAKNGHFCLSEFVGICREKPTNIAFII